MKSTQLLELYNKSSKHSHYQLLASPLKSLIPDRVDHVRSRRERERLDFMLQYLPVEGLEVADIGGNTGFFTLELLQRGAKSALFIEGNEAHSSFVQQAAGALGWQDRVTVYPRYFDFKEDLKNFYADATLLLNVLHHVGDDYGDKKISREEAKKSILSSLGRMAYKTRYLFFQMGYNWKGDVERPLFDRGTKEEMINFIRRGTRTSWSIERIGIAEMENGRIAYKSPDAKNLKRSDELGEFLNRPIFLMKSKLVHSNTGRI